MTTIYRHYQGAIQKLQPLTEEDFIYLCEVIPALLNKIFVTPRGRYYLILN